MCFSSFAKSSILAFIVGSLFTNCNGRKENELKDPLTGKLVERFQYTETSNGSQLKDGFYKRWYSNGQLNIDGTYERNRRVGEWKIYNDDGSLQELAHLVNDSLEGKVERFFKSGKKQSEAVYSKNNRNGPVSVWLENGQISEQFSTKDDQKDGPSILFYPNGKKRIEAEFTNGEYNGPYTEYFENGTLFRQGSYASGLKHGSWITNNTTGELFAQEEYDNGKNVTLVGRWLINNSVEIEYFKDGFAKSKDNKGKVFYSIEAGVLTYSFHRYTIKKLTKNEYVIVASGVKSQTYRGVRL
ncbi:hypothetical protein WSM22_23160 [Cytophagales bacterium WSM2-2]|nr:hypothetical protein WSM22_23160 [Cytophagales bacterium WSM2-2]